MGLSTQSLVVGAEGKSFAEKLKAGSTFRDAFWGAANENQVFSALSGYNAKKYTIMYYGPAEEGTLNDTITSQLPYYDRSEGTRRTVHIVNKHANNDFVEE